MLYAIAKEYEHNPKPEIDKEQKGERERERKGLKSSESTIKETQIVHSAIKKFVTTFITCVRVNEYKNA